MLCVPRRLFAMALAPAGLIAVASMLALALAAQPAQPVASGQSDAERIARIEQGLVPTVQVRGRSYEPATIEQRMAELKVPAVSVAVVNGGRIEWARAWGLADVEGNRPATAETLFQAASISKPLAATAALRLVDQGELALDEPVNGKLATWTIPENELTARTPVTLRHLLSHTGGTTVHGFPGYAAGKPVPTVQQILDGEAPANTAAIRVDLAPGTEWRYSGGGYTILQQLLCDVTGEPFEALMERLVLEPAGMTSSTYAQPLPAELADRAAIAYDAEGVPVEGRYHTYPEQAAAGLWTTPSDLARWIIAIQHASAGEGDALLSSATAEKMLTSGLGGFGLGVELEGSDPAERRFSHGGSNRGYRCFAAGFIEGGRGIVVMTNADFGVVVGMELVQAIAREYGWPGLEAREIVPVALDASKLKDYAGTYAVAGTPLKASIEVDGERLMLSLSGDEGRELIPTGEDTFVAALNGMSARFVRDEEGKVVTLQTAGREARRVEGEAE